MRSLILSVLLSLAGVIAPAYAQGVVVRISDATICFNGGCWPALIGSDTHPGQYSLAVLHVVTPGYGPDVLMYNSTDTVWYAIHRTYNYGNVRNRHRLYHGTTPEQRMVTAGCVNVEPHIYDMIRDCCSNAALTIVE